MSQEVDLRLGIEIDFIPGNEEEMDRVATALPYDYVIGSVHRVDYEEVDHPDHMEIYEKWETYELYAKHTTRTSVKPRCPAGSKSSGTRTSSRSSVASRTSDIIAHARRDRRRRRRIRRRGGRERGGPPQSR